VGQGLGKIGQGFGTGGQGLPGPDTTYYGPTGSFSGGDFSGAFSSNPYYSGGGNAYGFTMP